jgi:hypothetical protein
MGPALRGRTRATYRSAAVALHARRRRPVGTTVEADRSAPLDALWCTAWSLTVTAAAGLDELRAVPARPLPDEGEGPSVIVESLAAGEINTGAVDR